MYQTQNNTNLPAQSQHASLKIPWRTMNVVIEDKDFAEAVNIATESFVEHVLGHISNLRLSDDSERGLNLHHITRFSKLGQFL